MKIAIALLNVAFLVYISYRIWRLEQSSLRNFFWPALFLKWAAGICLGLIYTHYYTAGDTFSYFQDGVKLAQLARTDVGSYLSFLWSGDDSFPIWSHLIYRQPRAMFLSKITSVFSIMTADNYWIISLYFSTIAFVCAWLLAKKIITSYKDSKWPAIISFLFFPSVVFWSAGVIKESMAMAALYFLSFIFLKVWQKENLHWIDWLFTLISFWLLWNLKYYYLAIFLPVAFTTLAFRFLLSRFTLKSLLIKVFLWFLIFLVPLLLVSNLHPNFYPERFIEVVLSSYQDFQAISNPDDLIHYNSLEATPRSMLQHAPKALLSGLFRPFITEAHTILQYLVATENLMLLILTVSAFTQLKELIKSENRILVFSILVYTSLLCVFLALSTPNFGTLSRYRVGFLPYLVFVLTNRNPLINKLMTLKIFKNLVR